MSDYVHVPVSGDAAAIKQAKVDDLEAAIPGLVVARGTLLDQLLEIESFEDAQAQELATDVRAAIFRYFGLKIRRIPPRDATQATGASTWTLADDDGHTIPAGTELTLTGSDGSRVAFTTVDDVTVPPGSTVTSTGEVELIATVPGAAGTGLQAGAEIEDRLTWVQSITLPVPTTGGEDAESDENYLNRLADAPQPPYVRPVDFSRAARNMTGVARALPLDLYDADTDTADVGGHMTVAVMASNGGTVSTSNKDAVQLELDTNSITNLTVHVIDGTYNALTIVFAGVAHPGYDAGDVEARAEAALADFINPANWGLPPDGDQPEWIDTPTVRYQDLITVLNQVDGFDRYTTLTLNGGTADVVMTGPAALPDPASTVSGTVT